MATRAHLRLIRQRIQLLQQGRYQDLVDLAKVTAEQQPLAPQRVEPQQAAGGGLSLRQARRMHKYATRGRVLTGMKMLHSAGLHDCTPEVVDNLSSLLAPHDAAP
eukprot:6475440-Amphidinium_carterae.1